MRVKIVQNRVLLIAAAAFAGGVASTIMAASYLTAPVARRVEDRPAPSVLDTTQVKPVAVVSDGGSCPGKTWPYTSAGCGRAGEIVPSIMPAKVELATVTVSRATQAVAPSGTAEPVASVPPPGAIQPLKAEKVSAPVQAPQPLEPIRSVEFERSTDAANRPIRVIAIDRASNPSALAAQTGGNQAGPAQPDAAASGGAPAVPNATGPAVPAANPTPVARMEPPVAKPPASADTARSAPPSAATKDTAQLAPAAPPVQPNPGAAAPSSAQAAKPGRDGAAQPERPQRSASRKLAREDEEEMSERESRRRSRRGGGEWVEREPPRTAGRRGYYAAEEAPPRAPRQPGAGGRDSVFGWLGSPN